MIRILIAESSIGIHLGGRVCAELPSSERMRCDRRPREENCATPARARAKGRGGRGRATDGKRMLAALRETKLLPRLREYVVDNSSQSKN